MLVDSHCHINFDPLGAQLSAVFERAKASGVGHMLCVSVNLEDYPQVRALAHAHANVFASVGVHPNERDGGDPSIEELVALARDARVVAIGETGLDYYRCSGDMDWQQQRFRRHIRAALATGKPLIVHTREAASDTLRIMEEEGASAAGGVMHCFTEGWDTAQRALAMNFYISFSGIVTFRSAAVPRDVATRVPAERLLVETDAPYLAPIPHRGRTNEPAYVRHVAECLAELRATTFEAIADQTTRNFFTLFSTAQPIQ
ncbi:MAG: DNAase [Candidatus Muproteobacteria bacterium RBG_16_64_11]|uniref:DNAase n=1 Tax=Candidatus Muproteobacteria bacterium RBG_16_64_11 TaxID=1817758 RepID=A0A1F6TBK5_9PROT|nr:MAG: DNAase [Candidatus Muproteobacteria bacterium RBG_16_64_11]